MADRIDIAIWQYTVGVMLLIYNLILYTLWNFVSKNHRDKRYRAVCINVIMLIMAFIYSFSLGLYARNLRETSEYEPFMTSQFWAWRYTPVLLLFLVSSIRLTKWAIITIKLYFLKKKKGEKFNGRYKAHNKNT